MNYFIINSDDFDKRVDIMDTNKNQTITKPEKVVAATKVQKKLELNSAQFVKKMLKDLPKDLREMFTPKNNEDLEQLEMKLIVFNSREKERSQIIQLQKQFDLPIRPNMSLRDTAIRVKLVLMHQRRSSSYNENNYTENDENNIGGPQSN